MADNILIDLWEANTPFDARFSLFGTEIQQKLKAQDDKKPLKNLTTFSLGDDEEDVAFVTTAGAYLGAYDLSGSKETDTEKELIYRYRQIAEYNEVDSAINDIVDEAIASLEAGPPVKLLLDEMPYTEEIKKKLYAEFNTILKLYNFSERGADLFRRWYVDGRLYFHVVIDRTKLSEGIQKLVILDPTKIKKVKEVEEKINRKTGVKQTETVNEYYVYTEDDPNNVIGTQTIKISKEAIIEVNSGLTDPKHKRRISYLHKALKPANQLRIMEDALVIYRLSRAPERRVFYVDTGNLPTGKAEEYIRRIMAQYKNKVSYDITTGEVKSDRAHINMLEDFWLPRREGSRGTEIETLPSGQSLGEIEDILYFKNQLYKSLNIPQTRIDPEASFPGGSGRALEITRDEVKFQKFINRLRKKFAYVLLDALKVQLQLKSILSESDWEDIVQDINIDFVQDNHFYELKDFEVFQNRISIMRDLKDYIGDYFSRGWVQRKIFQMSEEEINDMNQEIEQEKKDGFHSNDSSGGSRW